MKIVCILILTLSLISCNMMVPVKETQVAEIKLIEPTKFKPQTDKQLYTDKVYDTDLEGLEVVQLTFKNVVLYVYNQEDEQFTANLQATIALIDAKAKYIDVIFVKANISKLDRYELGLHIKHFQEEFHFSQEQVKQYSIQQLNNHIASVIAPRLGTIEQNEVEEYLTGDHVKLLLIMDSSHSFFEKVKSDFEVFLKNGALKEAAIEDLRCLNVTSFRDYKSPSLLLYKPDYPIERYDNNITYFDQITDFINLESLPLVIPLNAQYYARVFGGSVNKQIHLLIDDNQTLLMKEFQQASKNNKQNDLRYERLLFTYSNFEDNQDLWTQFDFTTQTKAPQIVITKTNFRKFQLEKYVYDEDAINAESIGKFLERFREYNITQFHRSEQIPEHHEDQNVLKVVGKTFSQEIMKGRQNTVVLFWDSKNLNASKNIEQVLRAIAEDMPEDKREFLKFVTFDLALNEHPSITIDSCPQLYLYLAGDKRRPKDYNLEITQDQIKAWLSYWILDLELVKFKPEGGYTVVDLVEYKEEIRQQAENFAFLKQAAAALKAQTELQAEQAKQSVKLLIAQLAEQAELGIEQTEEIEETEKNKEQNKQVDQSKVKKSDLTKTEL